jgi:hypothetical protein
VICCGDEDEDESLLPSTDLANPQLPAHLNPQIPKN